MRPIVFGPSPFMQVAEGVLGAKQLAAQSTIASEDRARKQARDDQQSELGMLSIAHQRIQNTNATTAQERDRAEQVRADADALELRSDPVLNADGRFGRKEDAANKDVDYRGIMTKERKIAETAAQLIAAGNPKDFAWEAARKDQSATDLKMQAEERKLKREEQTARIEHIRAQTGQARAAAARPDAASRSELTAARKDATSRRREMQSVLLRRPTQKQFIDPTTKLADSTGFDEAMTNWRADSTERKGAEDDANAELRTLLPGMTPLGEDAPPAPAMGTSYTPSTGYAPAPVVASATPVTHPPAVHPATQQAEETIRAVLGRTDLTATQKTAIIQKITARHDQLTGGAR